LGGFTPTMAVSGNNCWRTASEMKLGSKWAKDTRHF